MATPHNSAEKGAFAKTVLMPGDPLRAKFIAENFLEDAVLVNNVRGIQGYTGTYKGTKVSVMASGMGIPSIAIYSYELFSFYGVENIIRIGSAGAIDPSLNLFDVVFGMSASTNSNFASQYGLVGTVAPTASFELLMAAKESADEIGKEVKVGNIYSSDTFYNADPDCLKKWGEMGALATEMEAAGLYLNAAKLGKRALAICTISDCPLKGGVECTPEERQNSFTTMMEIALNTAIKMENK